MIWYPYEFTQKWALTLIKVGSNHTKYSILILTTQTRHSVILNWVLSVLITSYFIVISIYLHACLSILNVLSTSNLISKELLRQKHFFKFLLVNWMRELLICRPRESKPIKASGFKCFSSSFLPLIFSSPFFLFTTDIYLTFFKSRVSPSSRRVDTCGTNQIRSLNPHPSFKTALNLTALSGIIYSKPNLPICTYTASVP